MASDFSTGGSSRVRSWRFVVNGDLKLGIGLLMFRSLFLRYVVIELAQRYDSKSSRVGKAAFAPALNHLEEHQPGADKGLLNQSLVFAAAANKGSFPISAH
jgi:hypothetical protein